MSWVQLRSLRGIESHFKAAGVKPKVYIATLNGSIVYVVEDEKYKRWRVTSLNVKCTRRHYTNKTKALQAASRDLQNHFGFRKKFKRLKWHVIWF